MMLDSHAHYDDGRFDEDREAVIASLNQNGVGWVINAGCDVETTAAAVALAEKYDFFYATAGFHPGNAHKVTDLEVSMNWLRNALSHPKVVALGEIGLDYHYDEPSREKQAEVFEAQLCLAEELGVPVVIHDREAHGDIMDAVLRHPDVRGVFHSFSGSPEMAKELIKRGWYISFSGVVTFKNAAKLPEVAARVPEDRFLIETDAPYLAPHPHRGKRNDSTLMAYTAERIAEIRDLTPDEVRRISAENARRLYPKLR
ncbi:MAG: TatD family hydrolase [Clostridia bacterium]|nr:TatD family hydrolase [Clostridia bacterium]